MKNATQTHLSRLVKVFGTFSAVARYLGFTPRWMRHIRAEVISPQSAFKIRIAGSNLQLRALLRELRNAGVVIQPRGWLRRYQRGLLELLACSVFWRLARKPSVLCRECTLTDSTGIQREG